MTWYHPDMIDVVAGPFTNGGMLAVGDATDAVRALEGIGGYNMVLFCARNFPPPPQGFDDRKRKVRVYSAPLDDVSVVTPDARVVARSAAEVAAHAVGFEGQRVLVTSNAGVNRSALVAALTLHKLSGAAGLLCAKEVKTRCSHGQTLTNPAFIQELTQLPAKTDRRGLPKLEMIR